MCPVRLDPMSHLRSARHVPSTVIYNAASTTARHQHFAHTTLQVKQAWPVSVLELLAIAVDRAGVAFTMRYRRDGRFDFDVGWVTESTTVRREQGWLLRPGRDYTRAAGLRWGRARGWARCSRL